MSRALLATLIINRFDSRCSFCGHGCLPNEDNHVTRAGYLSEGQQGCGAKFVALDSDYIGMQEVVTQMRPDLPWIGVDGGMTDD